MQLVSTINSVVYTRLSIVSMTVRWESECGVSAQLFDYSTTICHMLCNFMVIHQNITCPILNQASTISILSAETDFCFF